jgi:hypothetical protein
MNMKKTFIQAICLLTAIATATPVTFAQNASPRPVVVTPAITPGPDGKLNYTSLDQTKLMDNASLEIINRSKDDKDFLEKNMKIMTDAYNKIAVDLVIGKLQKMADQSAASYTDPVKLVDFLAAKREYAAQKVTYSSALEIIKAIPNGALPSAQLPTGPDQSVTVPAWRSVKVDGIVNDFTKKLEDLDSQINGMSFNVVDKTGARQDKVAGFAIDMSKVNTLTPQERDAMQADINKKKGLGRGLTEEQNRMHKYFADSLDTLADLFGKSTQYWERDDGFDERLKNKYEEVVQIAWAISYMRRKTGTGQGAIRMTYKKQWANLELMFRNPKDFVDYGTAKWSSGDQYLGARLKKELDVSQESIALNQSNSKFRDTDYKTVFEQIKAGNAAPMALAGSIFTYLSGRRVMMKTAEMLLKLAAADVEEELIVTQQGIDKMEEYYHARWKSNDTDLKLTHAWECQYDGEFTEKKVRMNATTDADKNFSCGGSKVGSGFQVGSLGNHVENLNRSSKGALQNLKIAAQLQASLDEASGASKADDDMLESFKKKH